MSEICDCVFLRCYTSDCDVFEYDTEATAIRSVDWKAVDLCNKILVHHLESSILSTHLFLSHDWKPERNTLLGMALEMAKTWKNSFVLHPAGGHPSYISQTQHNRLLDVSASLSSTGPPPVASVRGAEQKPSRYRDFESYDWSHHRAVSETSKLFLTARM